MKTNAFTRTNVRLYRVWGDVPHVDLPPGTPLFVCWAPILKQWIGSVTHIDYRYDSILESHHFMLDASMLPVDEPEPAETYYLNRLKYGVK